MNNVSDKQSVFSRVHATLYVTMSVRRLVGWSVGLSVGNAFVFYALRPIIRPFLTFKRSFKSFSRSFQSFVRSFKEHLYKSVINKSLN